VAKHGNRGSKKANGSFDFLDAMGIPYDLTPAEHQAQMNQYGCTFLFARNYHAAVRHVGPARQQLAGRSIFNLIGPFCNPASPNIQIIGAPSKTLAKRLMDVGSQLNYDTFAVITSDIGLDECSTVGDSTVYIRRGNNYSELVIHPEDYGFHHTLDDISVSADALAVDNAAIFKEILFTKNTKNPIAQLIALNAAVMMHVVDDSVIIMDGIKQVLEIFSSKAIQI
jgi:anthranilate phosphoribosyltransferase